MLVAHSPLVYASQANFNRTLPPKKNKYTTKQQLLSHHFRFASHPGNRHASNLAAGPWCSRVSTHARNALTPPGAPHTSISPFSKLFSALVRLSRFTPALANVRLLWQFVLSSREMHEKDKTEGKTRQKGRKQKRNCRVDQCSISHTDRSSPEQRNDSNVLTSNLTLPEKSMAMLLVNFTSHP